MICRFARALIILALCLSIGAHWIALQSVAWGTMIVGFAKKDSLVEAVAKTLDGNHPCSLCKRITKAKRTEKKQDKQQLPAKPDLICATRTIVLVPPQTDFPFSRMTPGALTLADSPAVPPPRSELV